MKINTHGLAAAVALMILQAGLAAQGGGVWSDHGFALPGAHGTPNLVGRGQLLGDTQIALQLRSAPPLESAILVIGDTFAPQPYKGGTLVPSPDIVIYGLYVDAGGALAVAGRWPLGIPSGYQLFFQYWIPDATGGHDVYTASNTISGTAP